MTNTNTRGDHNMTPPYRPETAAEIVKAAAQGYAGEQESRSHSDENIAAGDRIRAAVAELLGDTPPRWPLVQYERERAILALCKRFDASPDDDGAERGQYALVVTPGDDGDEIDATIRSYGQLVDALDAATGEIRDGHEVELWDLDATGDTPGDPQTLPLEIVAQLTTEDDRQRAADEERLGPGGPPTASGFAYVVPPADGDTEPDIFADLEAAERFAEIKGRRSPEEQPILDAAFVRAVEHDA